MENIISSKSENNIAQIELDDIYKKNKITITLLTFKPSLSMIDNS